MARNKIKTIFNTFKEKWLVLIKQIFYFYIVHISQKHNKYNKNLLVSPWSANIDIYYSAIYMTCTGEDNKYHKSCRISTTGNYCPLCQSQQDQIYCFALLLLRIVTSS